MRYDAIVVVVVDDVARFDAKDGMRPTDQTTTTKLKLMELTLKLKAIT